MKDKVQLQEGAIHKSEDIVVETIKRRMENKNQKTGLKILVVEDDFSTQIILESVLAGMGQSVSMRWATSAESAERLIDSGIQDNDYFDLVVIDVFLDGDKTGLDLWKKYQHLPMQFLFETSLEPAHLLKLIGAQEGAVQILRKPLQLDVLKSVIENLGSVDILSSSKSF